MKDAYGGIINLAFIVVFLLIVIGVLGLVVSYTKAFKMKNEAISIIEEYEGSGCVNKDLNGVIEGSPCMKQVEAAAERIGYGAVSTDCQRDEDGNEYNTASGYYCFFAKQNGNYLTVRVTTKVNIDLPIINKIMGFNVFRVSGDTERIYFNN